MVIEVLIEVAHGGALGYAPRPRARGARDPGGDYGDGWWVRACERGEVRRCENARMHCDEAMCFLRLLRRRVACYAFSRPRCPGATPSFAPRPRLQTLGYHR